MHLIVSWTCCQFRASLPDANLDWSRPKGGNMNEFNSWTDINWYALGSLLIQLVFLVAGLWFARNFLRTLRAFQEQIGALLKLSILSTPSEPHPADTRRRSAEASQYWLFPRPTEAHNAGLSQPSENRPSRFAVAWHRMMLWLQAPSRRAEVSAWRRLTNWLEAPAGS
jgi:hypothetical protein